MRRYAGRVPVSRKNFAENRAADVIFVVFERITYGSRPERGGEELQNEE